VAIGEGTESGVLLGAAFLAPPHDAATTRTAASAAVLMF